MVKAGISNPPNNAAKNAITKDDLARHCRRRTQGTERSTDLIETFANTCKEIREHYHNVLAR